MNLKLSWNAWAFGFMVTRGQDVRFLFSFRISNIYRFSPGALKSLLFINSNDASLDISHFFCCCKEAQIFTCRKNFRRGQTRSKIELKWVIIVPIHVWSCFLIIFLTTIHVKACKAGLPPSEIFALAVCNERVGNYSWKNFLIQFDQNLGSV